jgi:digalactosyldiacylglycerol synthase
LYGSEWKDATEEYQRQYMLDWLKNEFAEDHQANDDDDDEDDGRLIQIHFYTARYHAEYGSIFPMGDICGKLPECSDGAICVLEEPEHLNYFRAPSAVSWRHKFAHVVGVIHTNYPYYAAHNAASANSSGGGSTSSNSRSIGGSLAAPGVEMFSAWMVQAYCDKVIKLSAALPVYAESKEVVSAVHGIRNGFLQAGRNNNAANNIRLYNDNGSNEIYFLGKLLWAKGLDKLKQLQEYYREQSGEYFAMDIYGSGPDQEEIERLYLRNANEECDAETATPLPVKFKGRIDHASLGSLHRIFVNPSESEVLCTTTAEAIAMEKFAIVPDHPSNMFFTQFPNCLLYQTDDAFVSQLQYALTHTPEPLSEEHGRLLTWEAATERFIEAAGVSERDAAKRLQTGIVQLEHRLAALHYLLGSGRTGDVLRNVFGGGPCAKQYAYETDLQERQRQTTNDDEDMYSDNSETSGKGETSFQQQQPTALVT